MSQANGNSNNYFNMVVSSSSRREVVRTHMDTTLKKALNPVLKRWGYRDISKVAPQLRYYELELKSDTKAGDTAGMEVFIKTPDSTDPVLRGFHPFINKSSLKDFTQQYLKMDGWFLTRESSTGDGQLSLAVTFCDQLRHFKINFCSQEGYYKIASKSFENLHQLFSYYTDHPLKKSSEGVIYLLNPILVAAKSNGGVDPSPSRPLPPIPNPRPLPQIPPPSDESPPPPIMPKVNPNSRNALNPPVQLVPSYPDKLMKPVATPLSLTPQSSPMSPITNDPNKNRDDSIKATPSPISHPVDANPATRGEIQKSNTSNISPAPAQTDNLPLPWKQVYSNSQKKYYFYNIETCVTSWKLPLTAKDYLSNSEQESRAKMPSKTVSSTELSGRGPVRQRSQSFVTGHRPERKRTSPDKLDLFTAINVAECAHSDSQRKIFNRAAPSPPNHSESTPRPKSKQVLANKPQRNESPYDTLPATSTPLPPNQYNKSNPFPIQLKPIEVSKHPNSTRSSGKFSDPVSKSPPSKPSPIPNSAPTGKTVKFGKYSIPAPPPNIPPAFSVETTPHTTKCNPSPKSKCMTLPNGNTNNTINGLIDSIQRFPPHQLKSVTPDRVPPSPVDNDNNNILAVLKRRLEQRSEFIQDSDQSDSSYEDADADW